MAKSDILSSVSARIAAATSATPADELATLKVLGTKLGLDTSNIVVQANTASATASAKDLYDVALLNQALDEYQGNKAASLSFPFAVEQGDVIQVNEFGSMFNNNFHDILAAGHQIGTYTSSISVFGSQMNNVYPLDASMYSNTISDNTYYTLFADNEDIIVLFFSSSSSYSHNYYVLSEKLKKATIVQTVSSGALLNQYAGVPTGAAHITHIYKTAANTWKVYYLTNEGNGYDKLHYKTFTYNPTSKTLSSAQSAGVLVGSTNNSTRNWSMSSRSEDGLFTVFTYYTGTTNTFYVLNNSTSVFTEITNVATTTNNSKVHVVKDSGNADFIVIANPIEVKIATIPGNVSVTVPAAAIPILKYSSVNQLGLGQFICANSAGKEVRLLKFNAGLTSVTVYTLGTDNTANGNVISFNGFLKQNDLYFLYNNVNNVYCFKWDGTNAPEEKNIENKPLYKYVSNFIGSINPNLKVLSGSQDASSSTYYLKVFYFTQSILWSNKSAKMFKANKSAAANTSVEVTILNGVLIETKNPFVPGIYGYCSYFSEKESIKLNYNPVVAIPQSGSGIVGIYLNQISSLGSITNNVIYLKKPGKYIINSIVGFTVHNINQTISFVISNGLSYTFSIQIESTVPFFIQGSATIMYIGD